MVDMTVNNDLRHFQPLNCDEFSLMTDGTT